MPAKQKVKKTKPSSSTNQNIAEFRSIVGEPLSKTPEASSTTSIDNATEPKRKRGFQPGYVRRPKSELLLNVMGRKYTKTELHSKVLQVSGKSLLTETVLRDNIKRLLHTERFLELLPSQQKSYSFGRKALPFLKEHLEYQLTNLLYIANVIAVSKGKSTIGEGEVLLADLILRGKLNIHGDKYKTQQALIKSQTKSKKETISLGQDVNIDKVAMILQEALSSKDGEVSSSSLISASTDKLKKAILEAEEKFHDVLTAEPSKKRKKEDMEEEEEEEEFAKEEEEEEVKEPAKKTKEEKKTEEPKPKKKKTSEKKTTKK